MRSRADSRDELAMKKIHYIAGELDPIVNREQSLEEMKQVLQGKSIMLKNVGHMSYLENEKIALKAILSCLN